MKKIKANIFIDQKIQSVEIEFNSHIKSITPLSSYDAKLSLLIPGFTDLHVHGGGGKDIMEGGDAIEVLAKTHLKNGTTSFLATTMTAPYKELEKAFKDMKDFYYGPKQKSHSRLLGVHLEGPYISDKKLGAQPNHTRQATLDEIKKLHSIVPIKIITIAPEIFNHLDLIAELTQMGIVVQIGHTNGTYEDGVRALDQGAKSFTHLFNAMSSFHHRAPGISGAALAHATYSELIPDLEHVHPGAIRTALKCIPKLYFVTDSTAATGMPDGEYLLGEQKVHKCLGGVRLKDGTLAGSSLSMGQALKNLIKIGLPPYEASWRLSGIPNELLLNKERGSLELDSYADFLLLDSQYEIETIYSEGEQCDF